ncbi:MAG: hypothetical protein KGN38_02000 [Actinomycetales bacterium]|nr:hypothetical protein [Actinomycetales bacterium]
MPTYEYACADCGHDLEAVQSFSDDPLTVCPECGGTLRKVFGNVGVVFKGSGFYRTDSRKSSDSGSSATKDAKSDSTGASKAESTTTSTTGSTSSGSTTPSPTGSSAA